MKATYEVRISFPDPESGFPFIQELLVKDFNVVEAIQLEQNEKSFGYTFEGYTLKKVYGETSALERIERSVKR